MKPYAKTKTLEWRKTNPWRRRHGNHGGPRRIGDKGQKRPARTGSHLRNVGPVALALLLLGCASVPAPAGMVTAAGLDRLYPVEHGPFGNVMIWRSAQPTEAQLGDLDARGVKRILKLDFGKDRVLADQRVRYIPILPAGPATHAQLAAAEREIEDAERAGEAIDVHCVLGVDRTGLVIALWRVRHGWTPDAAFAEWLAHGSHRFVLLELSFQREVRLLGFKDWKIPR